MTNLRNSRTNQGVFLCALAAVIMAFGWGYRGIVGYEGGAMVPGAMLGMAVCLGSGRPDWIRRSAVAGLFGAVGWAWGGSFSYMEQTMYTVSDSFPDVLYGYSCLFLLGGLWAGVGGAILGLVFTLPRSHLRRFVGPFTAMSAVFLAFYLYFFFNPIVHGALERFTAQRFDDTDWFAAVIVIVVCGLYGLVRPKERAEAGLFVACAIAWWIGYLGFTKLGGLRLAPPYRNEGWGGVVGILVVLLVYLIRQRNRAALMLSLYGILGGGIAFALAVFVRHPIRVKWGPFAPWNGAMQWKIAEESFGLFMGLAIALGVLRLARGGLVPAKEDEPSKSLDVYAVFVILIGLMWVNLRRAPMAWISRYHVISDKPVAGMMPWVWFTVFGLILSALALYALYLYGCGRLAIAPATAYGKGALVLLLLMWIVVAGSLLQQLPGASKGEDFPLVDATFITFAAIATAMILSRRERTAPIAEATPAPPSDLRWNVGIRYGLLWACVPIMLLAFTGLSMAMQDGMAPGARKRFGPDAYWRQMTQMVGEWRLTGRATQIGGDATGAANDAPVALEFTQDRKVLATLSNGACVDDAHAWQHKDSVVWLEWFGRQPGSSQRASIGMTLKNGRLHIPWPPNGSAAGYLVYERSQGK
ncbi:MAG: hypothetical protein HZB26_14815 [Candidatus Hydrogenedentes bacterium]|nr:hypothetical protein [Candidatus Hydrogenedentota bacterium]